MEDFQKSLFYSDEQFTIYRQVGITPAIDTLLEQVTWGTKETLYQRLDTLKYVRLQHSPVTMSLEKDGVAYVCAMFSFRATESNAVSLPTYFIRYFAAHQALKGKGIVRKYGSLTMDLVRKGHEGKGVFTALIEAKNKNAYELVTSVGYKPIAYIKTLGFSRFFPKKLQHVITANKNQYPALIAQLNAHYKQYSFVQFRSLETDFPYYMLEENGRMVAGIQVFPSTWIVKALPGKMGKVLVKVLPYIPLLNKIFNPKQFKFISFDAIYCENGYEKQLLQLMEHALAVHKVNTGLTWLDEKSALFKTLIANGNLGLMHAFMKNAGARFLVLPQAVSEADMTHIAQQPIYISAFDCI